MAMTDLLPMNDAVETYDTDEEKNEIGSKYAAGRHLGIEIF